MFRMVVLTRSWNASHGGVYVPIPPETQPNPYLEDPLREVITTGGLALTKVNPAYMTRLVGGMVPLAVIQSCMNCHAKQGNKVGDIRGGISVSLPFAPIAQSTQGHVRDDELICHDLPAQLLEACRAWHG